MWGGNGYNTCVRITCMRNEYIGMPRSGSLSKVVSHLWTVGRRLPLHLEGCEDTALQQKSYLCLPRTGIEWTQTQFPHSCVYERFIYSQNRSTYFPADGSWEYINRSQTHECGNWDWGRSIPFLGISVSNFRYCVFAVRVETENYLMKSPPSETVYSFSLTAYLKRYLHGTNTLIHIILFISER